MTSGLGAARAAILAVTAITGFACASQVDRESPEDVAAEHRAAETKALAAFAAQHGALPTDLLAWKPLDNTLTVVLQRKYEGVLVAFRGSVLDVVRQHNDHDKYEVHVGHKILPSPVAILRTDEIGVLPFLEAPSESVDTALFVVQVDRIAPFALTETSCSGEDCADMSINFRSLGGTYRIFGALVSVATGRR